MACITGNLALMCHRGYSKSLPTPSGLVNLSAFLLRMKNGTKPRWIHPAHMRAFLQKIAASLPSFFFFHSFLLVFPLSCPWAQPCGAQPTAGWGCCGREQRGPGVVLPQLVPACTGLSTLGMLGLAKAAPFPPHGGLSCSIPIFCSSL